ncbi:Reverse transcriptase [Arachis hypogaea]|nr:Reverse transcriptase [Arachis hypogaea]
MSIISWNCRGIAAAPTISELYNLCKKVKPLIVFLMETRASQERMSRIRRRLNFDKFFCVEPRGLSGGLCLLWKSNINIDVYEWCDNYIKASININNVMKWQGVFVYGNPVFQKRRKLWRELTVSNRNREEPQAVLGDFNDILSQDEKVGLHPQPKIYLDSFRKFVDDNSLIDIDLKGSRFTWYSNPRNNFVTRERLDRVLVNWKWLNLHQNVVLKAAPAISSDHYALILETQPKVRIKKEFRFEAFWIEHEECKEVIRRSWQQDDGNRNCWNQFIRKRGRCIRELTEWSRRKFKRADKEIEKKKNELIQIQKGDMTDRDQKREKELKNQINDLWKQEEKYWGQTSRLK